MRATPLISATWASAAVFLLTKLAVMPIASFPLSSLCLNPVHGSTEPSLGKKKKRKLGWRKLTRWIWLPQEVCVVFFSLCVNSQAFQNVNLLQEREQKWFRRNMCVCLTVGDKPASSSRDENIELEVCSRMRPRLQLGHPTCQEHTKLLCALHIAALEMNKKQQVMMIYWAKQVEVNTVFSWGLNQALKLHSGVHLHPEQERHFQQNQLQLTDTWKHTRRFF